MQGLCPLQAAFYCGDKRAEGGAAGRRVRTWGIHYHGRQAAPASSL